MSAPVRCHDAKHREGFVIFPAGFGTLDGLFEALTLIQTGKLGIFPVVLVGSAFWRGLLDRVDSALLAEAKIGPADRGLLTVLDDPDAIVRVMVDAYRAQQRETARGPGAKTGHPVPNGADGRR